MFELILPLSCILVYLHEGIHLGGDKYQFCSLILNFLGDLLAEAIQCCLELQEELCRCLDKEYKYGTCKCWKHIAEACGIKEQEYQNFKCSQVQSPTEVMFEYLKSRRPEVTIRDVKSGLHLVEREDVIAVFVKYEQSKYDE